jgi:aryl-alcohol dehydrogenase-like predicted oxidoreductase
MHNRVLGRGGKRVGAIAGRVDATPAQVALAWLLAQGEHVVPIPSTKSISRLAETVAASELQLRAGSGGS